MSDTTAVTIGATAYIVGGYTTTTPLRSVLAFRPGVARARSPRCRTRCATPPPRRWVGACSSPAAPTATRARDEILSVDPADRRVRVIGHLPARLAHAAGAALGDTFYVLGGRGDATTSQRRGIWAIDPATGHVRAAGPAADGALGPRRGRRRATACWWPAGATRRVACTASCSSSRAQPRTRRPRRGARHLRRHAPGDCWRPQVRGDPARVYVPNSQSEHRRRHRPAHGQDRRALRRRRAAPARDARRGTCARCGSPTMPATA